MFEKVVQDTFSKGNSDNVSFEDEFKSVIESKNVPKSTYNYRLCSCKNRKWE